MQLFINGHYFISVLPKEGNSYSCQIMELIHGMGMYAADILDNSDDIISSMVYESGIFKEHSRFCVGIEAVFAYHKECLIEFISYSIKWDAILTEKEKSLDVCS